MYIPTTFFSSQGSCFTVTTSTISGSSLITTGSFISGGVYWDYWKFETANYRDSSLTALTASFNVLSGSTGRAKLLIVGGGGTGTDGNSTSFTPNNSTITYDVRSAAGGGGGGVIYYDNFPLSSGSYEIGVANAVSGYILCGGCSSGTICGKTGNTSYIKLPNNLTYTPFTSSTLIAYGGGPGSVQGQFLRTSDRQVFFNAVPIILSGSSALFANGGGAAGTRGFTLIPEGNRPSPASSLYSTSSAGIGLGGVNSNNQGNNGGAWCGSIEFENFGGGSGGGGTLNSPVNLGLGCAGSGVYVTNGGDGLTFNLTGSNLIVGNGGGGANFSTNEQGIRGNSGANTYGSGGNGYKGTTTPQIGNGGVVIIAIPRCSAQLDCKRYAISGSGNTISYAECSIGNFFTSSVTLGLYDTLNVCLTTLSGSNTPLFLSGSYLSSTLLGSCDSISSTLIPTTWPKPYDTCSCLSYTFTAFGTVTVNGAMYCGSTTSGSITLASGSITTLCLNSSSINYLSISGSYLINDNGSCITGSCASTGSLFVNYLIVGGGGEGGAYYGGGGGAGGVVAGGINLSFGQSNPIVVGAGGTGPAFNGTNGETSSAFGYIALGGGGGAGGLTGASTRDGLSGASGGGGSYAGTISGAGGTALQGWIGGSGSFANLAAGGGGGAGPSNSSIGQGGPGGDSRGGYGWTWIDGNIYAGGGGGATRFTTLRPEGSGGNGGGGNGAQLNGSIFLRVPTSGSPNTGGGGGGAAGVVAGSGSHAGGSGIVKIRYVATASVATGGTITLDPPFVYHTFTGSGTFTT